MAKIMFLTECDTPDGLWHGPKIYADSWEQAEVQVLEIKHWLNSIKLPHGELRVLGIVGSIIEVTEDGEQKTVAEFDVPEDDTDAE